MKGQFPVEIITNVALVNGVRVNKMFMLRVVCEHSTLLPRVGFKKTKSPNKKKKTPGKKPKEEMH